MRSQNKLKKQNTGFTLIELLAVITIMGILMMVAIPAISNTIKNSRKDTYVSTSGEILSTVKNLVNSDSVTCGTSNLGAAPVGSYYLKLGTGAIEWENLLDGGVKSPFGNSPLFGTVKIDINASGKYTYSLYLTDKSYCIYGDSTKPFVEHKSINRASVKNDATSCGSEFRMPSGETACTISN